MTSEPRALRDLIEAAERARIFLGYVWAEGGAAMSRRAKENADQLDAAIEAYRKAAAERQEGQ